MGAVVAGQTEQNAGAVQRLALIVAVALVAAAAIAACAPFSGQVSIQVTPGTSTVDQPVSITVTGLQRDQRAQVQVTSIDAAATPWRARATFEADRNGDLRLNRARALSGSYRGVFGMGLVATMTPSQPVPPQDDGYVWGPRESFQVSVSANGRTLASRTFDRTGFAGVGTADEDLAQVGFVGRLVTPSHPSSLAVLFFGGSEGGLPSPLSGAYFALHGYRTLEVAYFNAPGLPPSLTDIPLEYFARALTWLHEQPGVKEVVVAGASRGSEAALLLGVHYPTLVQGVIASTPANVAGCGLSSPAGVGVPVCDGAAWTLGGRPLPYTRQTATTSPTDDPAAVIPVGQIRAPILLDCGEYDALWPSCPYSRAIESELGTAHDPQPHPLYAYPYGGHGVNRLIPYEPSVAPPLSGVPTTSGASPTANAQADAELWPHVLSFLSGIASG